MKKCLALLTMCLCLANAYAAYLRNIPMTVTQPDGTVLQCFASGDEYFNYLHDANGFTIMRHPQTSYYVYAQNIDGKLVATDFVVGRDDPAHNGLKPYALISPEEWTARRKAWQEPEQRRPKRDYIPNHGTLNNIAIFIRFSDDEQFTNSYASIDNMFNNVEEGAVSMNAYFKAASYGAIEIPTTFYPEHDGDAIISYQDTYPRSYFEPYDANTNPNGYHENQRPSREFSLLERAVSYINENYPIPEDIDLDYDEDGYIDNVCFIIKGGVGEWSSLLWPHKWSLYDRNVYINGKIVWTFNFQLSDAPSYFNTSVMCHEMNHSLSAPDLYHYYNGTDMSPVGNWDLMESNSNPPQHCGAYMKMKYGHWIDEIPEITESGTYTLNPISSPTPDNVAYKIATSDPKQFYVLEYRNKNDEPALYGSGLLVYRINTNFEGNAEYDPEEGIFDEVYLFRPGGYVSDNGSVTSAYFSANAGRTEFSPYTSAYPFFTDGTLDNDFMIYNITSAGSTISFTYGSSTTCGAPTNITLAVENTNDVHLSWDEVANASSYNVFRNGVCIGNATETSFVDYNLDYGNYTYFVRSIDEEGLQSYPSDEVSTSFVPDNSVIIGDGVSTTNDYLPSYTYYKYSLSQQIYTADEIGKAGIITSIAFYNAGAGKNRNFSLYLKSTTKSSFDSDNDWIAVSDADKVYQGNVLMSAGAWTFVYLDTPFAYDGTSNLVLVADDNSGSWSASPHMSCSVFAAPNQAIRAYDDYVNYNPTSPSSYEGTVVSVKNQIIMKIVDSVESYDVIVSAYPPEGGTATGCDTYFEGQSCTLHATPATGYNFVKWTKDGVTVSAGVNYTFTVTESCTYVANFQLKHFNVNVESNPAGAGEVTGAGGYDYGQTAELTATPHDGYKFVKWTRNNNTLSTDPIYSFTVTSNGTYKANFELLEGVEENTTPIEIFPNPTDNAINVVAENIISIRVSDVCGMMVYESLVGGDNARIDMSGFANGMYLVQIATTKGTTLHKVVKR